jgi:prephenate dehydratase
MQIGYLGPKGTYTEKAALIYSSEGQTIAYPTINDVVAAVDKGNIELGIVPIENSIEGTVNSTMDMIIFESNIKILAEIVVPIEHNLLVSKNYNGQKITKVLSHPQGLGQCRKFLNEFYHDSEQVAVSSTAEEARLTSLSEEPWAAIGNSLCAELYDMKVVSVGVQDNKTNETRFIVISKAANTNYEQKCKTSIAFSTVNEPGALFKILNILALWDLNMTKILSRPMKDSVGEYVFFVELEGDMDNEDMKSAMQMIQRKTSFYKLFGSYPVFAKVV